MASQEGFGFVTMANTAKASSRRSPRIPPIFSRATSRSSRKKMPMPYSLHVSAFWSYAIVDDLKWQQWQQWHHFQRSGRGFPKGKPETFRVRRMLKSEWRGDKKYDRCRIDFTTDVRIVQMHLSCKSVVLVRFGSHNPAFSCSRPSPKEQVGPFTRHIYYQGHS